MENKSFNSEATTLNEMADLIESRIKHAKEHPEEVEDHECAECSNLPHPPGNEEALKAISKVVNSESSAHTEHSNDVACDKCHRLGRHTFAYCGCPLIPINKEWWNEKITMENWERIFDFKFEDWQIEPKNLEWKNKNYGFLKIKEFIKELLHE